MSKLKSNLSEIARQAPEAAGKALLQTAADIVDLTKQLAPVRTGRLRKSYAALPVSREKVLVGTDSPYARHVEFGTTKASAQSHFIPAFVQAESTFKKRLKDEMEKIVK